MNRDPDGGGRPAEAAEAVVTAVEVTVDGLRLAADRTMPPRPRGVVLFAHGSGSSRHSPRNRRVASHLVGHGFGTVLADLLTEDEEQRDVLTAELRFDIGLLAERVTALVDWAATTPPTAGLPVGLFGASTGAAAALVAAAGRPMVVRAVVSRGGRPDLAGRSALAAVRAPTLLVVGGNDPQVRLLNEDAGAVMTAPHRLHVVPDATHLFEEPGALDEVAEVASQWFLHHLAASAGRPDGSGR